MIECRRNVARENLALLFDGAGFENALWIGAKHAARDMTGRDEAPEQPVPVEIACKARNAPAASEVTAIPIEARFRDRDAAR